MSRWIQNSTIERFVPQWEVSDNKLTETEAKALIRIRRKQHPKEKFRIGTARETGEPRGPEITD